MFVSLLMGGILIVCGFLTKAFPNLIAGYNTMPKEQKAKVDIKGLSSFMRNSMVILGLIIIGSYYFFKWFGMSERTYMLIPVAITIAGSIFMVAFAQKYDHNKK